MQEAKIVGRGVDTLVINVCYANEHFQPVKQELAKEVQHELEMGRSPLDVQRQMGHTTLTMTNHHASLTTEHLRKSQERFSPLRAKGGTELEGSSSGYWDE